MTVPRFLSAPGPSRSPCLAGVSGSGTGYGAGTDAPLHQTPTAARGHAQAHLAGEEPEAAPAGLGQSSGFLATSVGFPALGSTTVMDRPAEYV